MRVAAVIPNWDGLHYLQTLFQDLSAQTQPPAQILVVDNGSTDGSAEWAAGHGAQVVRFDHNRGFAVAVNRGVAESQCELVTVLNNDLRLSASWLETITNALNGTNASFAVGKVLSAQNPDLIDATYDAICRGGTAWRCGQGRADGPLWSVAGRIQFPPFTAVLLRRDDFLRVGGLDEALESYLEDVDFGLKCASKGYTGRYVPEAVAHHIGSGTLGRWHPHTIRQIARNQLLLVARHYPGDLLVRFGWRIAVAQLLWGLVAFRHGAGIAWALGKLEGARRFRSVRNASSDRVASVLEASEAELARLQRASGADLYWRLYFALT